MVYLARKLCCFGTLIPIPVSVETAILICPNSYNIVRGEINESLRLYMFSLQVIHIFKYHKYLYTIHIFFIYRIVSGWAETRNLMHTSVCHGKLKD